MKWLVSVIGVMLTWLIIKFWWNILNFLDDDLEDYIYEKMKRSFLRTVLQNIRKLVFLFWACIPIGSFLYILFVLVE